MKKTSRRSLLEVAYLAGFFDGEGCILIYKNYFKYKNYLPRPSYLVSIELVQKFDVRPLRLFQKTFGGILRVKTHKNVSIHSVLSLYSKDEVKKCLETLLPFLVIKKIQARLALKFFEVKSRISWGRKGKSKQLETFRQRMKLLKVVHR